MGFWTITTCVCVVFAIGVAFGIWSQQAAVKYWQNRARERLEYALCIEANMLKQNAELAQIQNRLAEISKLAAVNTTVVTTS